MKMRGRDRINPVLPDELILEVFHNLDSKPSHDACSLVCKRWLGLARLNRTTIRVGSSDNADALVQMLARRFVNVRNVFIDERLSISLPVQFQKHGGEQSALSSLTLHYANEKSGSEDEMGSYCLSDAGLTALGEGFTKLGCYVGDQGAAAVGKCCRQLEDLNLRFCEGLTDTGLIVLAIGCGKTLKSVGVAACAKLTDVSLEAIGSHCRSLEKLSLDSEFINNKGILAVAKGCRLLKVLKLQCINVTDEALQAVGIFCLSLELLALYSFQRFTDKLVILRRCFLHALITILT
ncbi:hypothetical protein CsSME_00021076 [Camellia sinensis var. sinensis]